MVPEGPLYETSAEPPDVVSVRGVPGFGFLFTEATSAGVEAVGINVFDAASAFAEKGQNALAWCGRRSAVDRETASPNMRNCWLDLMGNEGVRRVGLNTKTAYLSHFLRTSIAAILGV
ncbi:MAG: hypothetical protein AAB882_02130 [Patescibacteria group bacterium]